MNEMITKLVNDSKTTAVAKDEKVRFIIELTPADREVLRTLCKEDLKCGEIKFASDLFAVALKDARKAYDTAIAAQKATAPK